MPPQVQDGRRTPEHVLAWVRGRVVEQEQLLRLFRQMQFTRVVNRYGFVSVLRFYLYAEQGLSRQRVSVWIYEGELHLEYQETLLAQYESNYDRRQRRLQAVSQPTLYQTPFASPQMELFELDDEQWLKIRRRAYQKRQKRPLSLAKQLLLNGLEVAILVICHIMIEHLWGNFFPNV